MMAKYIKRSVGYHDERAQQPSDVAGRPPSRETGQESYNGQRCLHGQSTLLGVLSLGEQGSIVKPETGRLLGHVDGEGRSREHSGDNKCGLIGDHCRLS